MSANAIAAAQSGISEGLSLFYVIGGTILVCLSAFWGFGKIVDLLHGGSSDGGEVMKGSPEYYKARNEYNNSKRDSFSRWKQSNHE